MVEGLRKMKVHGENSQMAVAGTGTRHLCMACMYCYSKKLNNIYITAAQTLLLIKPNFKHS